MILDKATVNHLLTYLALLIFIVMGSICLLTYLKYDKNERFRNIGDFLLYLKLADKDKFQLLIMSLIFFFCAIMVICSILGISI